MPINSFLYPAKHVPATFEVANSARFNDGSSDYLTRSFGATQTSTAAFTISVWVKRSTLGTRQSIFAAYDGSADAGDDLEFETDDTLSYNGCGAGANTTSAKFRDVGAWYHIVLARNSGASGGANQVKIYVNGTLQTLSANNGCNVSQFLRNGLNSRIGANQNGSQYFVDMYMAEFVAIDGQMLDATSFGEFDSNSPTIWKPKDVSDLTFGTNGFHLDFENASSLGADVSGNSNNFTVNNLTSIDQTTDTCTNNFCTLSPLFNFDGSYTLSEGNLKFLGTGGNDGTASTMAVSSGRWYWECEFDGVANTAAAGFSTAELVANIGTSNPLAIFVGVSYFGDSINFNSSGTSGTASDGDIYGFYLDLEASSGSKTLKIYKNGSLFATETIPTAREGENFIPIVADASGTDSTLIANFGNPIVALSSANADANGYGSFEYNPTIGGVNYYALCTKNLAEYG